MYSSSPSFIFPKVLFLILDLIALGIAIARRQEHPQLSLWAGIYFTVQAILMAIELGINSFVLQTDYSNISVSAQWMFLTLINLCTTAIHIVATILLLYIIFGWRDEKNPLMIFKP
jgi:hypothetical protein